MFISVYTNTRAKFSSAFINLLSQEKMRKSSLWDWLKEKFLPVAKLCTRSLARVIISCFAKKDAFQNTDFSRLKGQLHRKQTDMAWFQPTREWINIVNLSSFQLENFFKFMLVRLAQVCHPNRESYGDLEPQWDHHNYENKKHIGIQGEFATEYGIFALWSLIQITKWQRNARGTTVN